MTCMPPHTHGLTAAVVLLVQPALHYAQLRKVGGGEFEERRVEGGVVGLPLSSVAEEVAQWYLRQHRGAVRSRG